MTEDIALRNVQETEDTNLSTLVDGKKNLLSGLTSLEFEMEEEDQGSLCREERQDEAPIKVLVTFKQREQENVGEDVKSCSRGGTRANFISESEEFQFPACQPVIPSPTCFQTDKVDCDSQGTEQNSVLAGWKGYRNNIYIQPISVHTSSCKNCNYSTNMKTQQKLTSEDLRKQIRFREAADWMTRHSDRIGSIGTLRFTPPPYEKRKFHILKHVSKDETGKVHKGFVCKSWAKEFLPQEDGENGKDEFAPFKVRKYVEKAKYRSLTTKEVDYWGGSTRCEKTKLQLRRFSSQTDETEKPKEDITLKEQIFEVQVNGKLNYETNCWEKRVGNFQRARSVPKNLGCSYRHKPTSERNSRSYHDHRSRSVETDIRIVLPVKQFPVINPLEEAKKPIFPGRKPRKNPPNYRPQTVDSVLPNRHGFKRSGQSQPHSGANYSNYANYASESITVLYGRKVTGPSLENRNKEDRKDEQTYRENTKFDQSINLLSSTMNSWNVSLSRGDTKTTHTVVHDGRGRERSASDSVVKMMTSRSSADVTQRSASDSVGKIVTSRSSAEVTQEPLYSDCVAGKRRPTKTAATHPLNCSELNSDSHDSGLGSEFECSFDGSAKLDVFLKPRCMSLE